MTKKSTNRMIGEYVERNDVSGLADFARAMMYDHNEEISQALKQQREDIVKMIEREKRYTHGTSPQQVNERIYNNVHNELLDGIITSITNQENV